MNLSQKLEFRKLLHPELKQSLHILALAQFELRQMIEEELISNPFLEESPAAIVKDTAPDLISYSYQHAGNSATEADFDRLAQLPAASTLHDALGRQLAVLNASTTGQRIGKELIGMIDDNGYLNGDLPELATTLEVNLADVHKMLKTIQSFEPYGVGAKNIQECLLIQCELTGKDDPLTRQIISGHLEDIARKKYSLIAKTLNASLNEVEASIKKIISLNPKPGQNFSCEPSYTIIPDIFIDIQEGEISIFINKEVYPSICINDDYRKLLKNDEIGPEVKEHLRARLTQALELIRAISRRHSTLRKVIEALAKIQKKALIDGMNHLTPLTLQEVATAVDMHESTISRVIMNKHVQTPHGLFAVKDFFTSGIQHENGECVSSTLCKDQIQEHIANEDKKHPLSDEDLVGILLKNKGIKLARRTVAKYRQELRILPSSLRRQL